MVNQAVAVAEKQLCALPLLPLQLTHDKLHGLNEATGVICLRTGCVLTLPDWHSTANTRMPVHR